MYVYMYVYLDIFTYEMNVFELNFTFISLVLCWETF